MRRLLDDGDVPLDNTRPERALRKIVVGRRNWLFHGSDTHAEAATASSEALRLYPARYPGHDTISHIARCIEDLASRSP